MSDRTHLRPMSPAKRIEMLENDNLLLRKELAETKAVLADCHEERGIGRQWLFVTSMPEYDHVKVALVIQADTEAEAERTVLEWGHEQYPDENWSLGPNAHLVREVGPIHDGIWGGADED